MKLYDFEILKGEGVVSRRTGVAVGDVKSVWPIVTDMARNADHVGCRIRVTDETGAIVVLTGVASAQLYAGTTVFSTPLL